MKSILLAAGMTVFLLLMITAVYWLVPTKRARNATLLYFLAAVLLGWIWWVTPPDLGFLPAALLAEPSWLDSIAVEFFFAAAFFGGILQLYNLAERGFSLRILIDLLEAPGVSADADWVVRNYSGGRGLDWMYRKRISGMVGGGFVILDDDCLVLTPKGRRTATIFTRLRRFSRLEIGPL